MISKIQALLYLIRFSEMLKKFDTVMKHLTALAVSVDPSCVINNQINDLIVITLITVLFILDPNAPNVQVTRMTLLCETAPHPLVLDLQGE